MKCAFGVDGTVPLDVTEFMRMLGGATGIDTLNRLGYALRMR
jgi:hypothetical protein